MNDHWRIGILKAHFTPSNFYGCRPERGNERTQGLPRSGRRSAGRLLKAEIREIDLGTAGLREGRPGDEVHRGVGECVYALGRSRSAIEHVRTLVSH